MQARPPRRLAYGQRIPRIAFAAAHERFYVLRRDQDHLIAELLKSPAPVVRTGAGLHGNPAWL
jgi:hypothetical protein